MGQNEVLQTQDDCEDEPDWDMMSVLPMTQCSTKKYNSKIWEYFGQLMRGTICVDNRNFYCLLCFQDRRFKQYSASTATSNFYVHLRTIHDLNIDRRTPTKSGITRQKTIPFIKKEDIFSDLNSESETHLSNEVLHTEDLNINTNDLFIEETLDLDGNDIFQDIPKRNFMNRRNRSKPYSPNTDTSLPLQIEESVNSEDYDQLFILSLIKEFRRIPDSCRLECKSEMMSVLRKYQTLDLNQDEEYLTIESAGTQSYTIITEIESADSLLEEESLEEAETVEYTFVEDNVYD